VYASQASAATRGQPPYEEWLRQTQNRYLSGEPDHVVEGIRQYAALGVTYTMVRFADLSGDDGLRLFAEEVIKHF